MTNISCPSCDYKEDIEVDKNTYFTECGRCRSEYRIPRQNRKGKREVREYKSSVNIRLDFIREGKMLHIAWAVQSADKGNQLMESRSLSVDISGHSEDTYCHVAVFKMLRNIEEYKDARIWVTSKQFLDDIKNPIVDSENPHRSQLKKQIIKLSNEKFYGCEFGCNEYNGVDIEESLEKQMRVGQ